MPTTKGEKMKEIKPMYRQGDVLIFRAPDDTPAGKAVKRDRGRIVLAYGEVTGHAHAIKSRAARLFSFDEAGRELDKLLEVAKTVALEHEEHSTIEIPAGRYIVRRQREYTPDAIRVVAD